MKRAVIRLMSVTALAVLAMSASAAWAGGAEDGLRHYCAHEFDEAIAACKGKKDVMSRLVLGLSFSERYGIYKNKQDKTDASMYLKILAVDVNVGDLPVIDRFLSIEGNPYGNKAAAKLLDEALDTVKTPEHVLLVSGFLLPEKGVDVNKMALSAIYKRLKPVRNYVSKGGSMPEADRALFTNATLIRRLIGTLGTRKTASTGKKCLTMIEEPALKQLEAIKELGKYEADAIVAIKKAVAKRVDKHPDSTWFSAYGK